ncbi:hypothetical protein [Calothrix sp. FACHB-1219]|nr:hypothetical protein [Calothrix sp. FACHB-1219]MBD2207766.1 hypothetical protein [Calothrix sp. FACHB-168]
MTKGFGSSNHRKPNLRHFYAYKKDGIFQSGLKLDYVRLTNTVMAPRQEAELDEDIKLIRTGVAKCKDLLYLDTRNLTSLTLRIALSLALILSTVSSVVVALFGGVPVAVGLGSNVLIRFLILYVLNFSQSLMAFCLIVFILTLAIKQVCFLVGITRVRVLRTTFWVTFFSVLLTYLATLLAFLFHQNSLSNITEIIISIPVASSVVAALSTFISSINIKNHPRIKIETEWQVNGRVYGEHPNHENIPVLYPKRGRDFYPLEPMEYRTLIAYQTAQGDRKQVKQLLKVWRTKPLVIEDDRGLFSRQNSNLLRRLIILLLRIIASMLAIFLEFLERLINSKTLNAITRWLKIQGVNRVFWIHQECEVALKQLIA